MRAAFLLAVVGRANAGIGPPLRKPSRKLVAGLFAAIRFAYCWLRTHLQKRDARRRLFFDGLLYVPYLYLTWP